MIYLFLSFSLDHCPMDADKSRLVQKDPDGVELESSLPEIFIDYDDEDEYGLGIEVKRISYDAF